MVAAGVTGAPLRRGRQESETIDCLIVGAGPAGLTAAIYAARFRLTVRVIDAGDSRAEQITCTRNHAGFPDGISGRELLNRMRLQAVKAGAQILRGSVTGLSRTGEGLTASTTIGETSARAVLLATGVTNRRPPMSDNLHKAALAAGRLRYCPVCDGFEVIDQDVAVIGTAAKGVKEAMFLREFTSIVTLVSATAEHRLTPDQRKVLAAAGVALADGPARDFALEPSGMSLVCGGGRRTFESVYPALGSDVHSNLAKAMGAKTTSENCIKVDAHQRTSVSGLYAAGDVVIGLDQISHAMGEAGVAATTIRNDLAARRPLFR
jgi:thioredoxin reductase (NADPH)